MLPVLWDTTLLRDASTTVVKETATMLAPRATRLPADLLWDMLTGAQRPAPDGPATGC